MKKEPLALTIVALLLTLACGPLSGLLDGDNGGGPAGDIDREQALFLSGGQPLTLDPAKTHSGPSDVIGAVFSGLVTLDLHLQVQPDLAAGWQISEDGTLYTFFLRRNALFHDGRPVTAEDVVFSWQRAASPATGSDTAQTYLGDIVGVTEMLRGEADTIRGLRVVDDYTLEVRIDAPKAYFLAKLTYPVAFVVDQNNVEQNSWERRPNGSGPFILARWEDDELIVLNRFNAFYLQPVALTQVVIQMGAGIPLSLYETGEIDLVGVGGSTLDRVQDPNNPLSAELRTGVSMCTTYIGLNNAEPPFDDVRVRQAFNYAVDKELLITTLFDGDALPATGILPPGMPGYSGAAAGYPFNPERARALLAEAGYPEGQGFPEVTFTSSGYDDPGAFVSAVITMWQDNLGVTVQPLLLEPFLYYDELYAGNTGNIFSSGWCADYPDPENFLDVLFHSGSRQNLGQYHNPEVDALLQQARVEEDVAARMALYRTIEEREVSDAPVVLVSHDLSAVLVKPYLRAYSLTPIGVPIWRYLTVDRPS
jgi:ABC-type transport system substrate-binding protein